MGWVLKRKVSGETTSADMPKNIGFWDKLGTRLKDSRYHATLVLNAF